PGSSRAAPGSLQGRRRHRNDPACTAYTGSTAAVSGLFGRPEWFSGPIAVIDPRRVARRLVTQTNLERFLVPMSRAVAPGIPLDPSGRRPARGVTRGVGPPRAEAAVDHQASPVTRPAERERRGGRPGMIPDRCVLADLVESATRISTLLGLEADHHQLRGQET